MQDLYVFSPFARKQQLGRRTQKEFESNRNRCGSHGQEAVQWSSTWATMYCTNSKENILQIATLPLFVAFCPGLRFTFIFKVSFLCHLSTKINRPDLVVCNTLLDNCQRLLQWQRALMVLESMPTFDLQPDEVTFTSSKSQCEFPKS